MWVKIRTGASLTNYCHGKTDLTYFGASWNQLCSTWGQPPNSSHRGQPCSPLATITLPHKPNTQGLLLILGKQWGSSILNKKD